MIVKTGSAEKMSNPARQCHSDEVSPRHADHLSTTGEFYAAFADKHAEFSARFPMEIAA
jgi:hypothetical protein